MHFDQTHNQKIIDPSPPPSNKNTKKENWKHISRVPTSQVGGKKHPLETLTCPKLVHWVYGYLAMRPVFSHRRYSVYLAEASLYVYLPAPEWISL